MIYIRGATAAKLLVVQILRYICYQGQGSALCKFSNTVTGAGQGWKKLAPWHRTVGDSSRIFKIWEPIFQNQKRFLWHMEKLLNLQSHNAVIRPFLILNLRSSLKLQLMWKRWELNWTFEQPWQGNWGKWLSLGLNKLSNFRDSELWPNNFLVSVYQIIWRQAPSVPGKILKKYPSPYWISYFLLYEN